MQKLFNKTIEAAINSILLEDEVLRSDILQFEGALLIIDFIGIDFKLNIKFCENKVKLYDEEPLANSITTISATTFDFINVLREINSEENITSSGLKISGDVAVVMKMIKVLKKTSIDWEQYLATKIGDVPASFIGVGLKAAREIFNNVTLSTGNNIKDFIQDEIELVPEQEEIEFFSDEVDQLRDDVARLETRITQLEK
ncbi:MAG: hypothetical protein HON78_05390 [Legionellales bacterium]|jgi:ubiquinone biosynthesis accessory factor UbiJ|nr:hypothetical protein [Legionellales bacterium]